MAFRSVDSSGAERTAPQAPPRVTSLPTNPYDGQIIHFVADAAAGVIWPLRYNAGSASPYKWEAIGATPLFSSVDTSVTHTATAYAALTGSPGPTVTLPLAGDYAIAFGMRVSNSVAQTSCYMSADFGATAANDTDAAYLRNEAAGVTTAASVSREVMKTLAAPGSVVSKYRVAGNTGTYLNRWLRVMPVRVG